VAAREGTVRQVSVPFGSGRDFSVVRGLEEEVRQACATASSLLEAPPAPGGEMPVVLDPILAGVFVHEAFGHLSEADGMHENPELEKTMRLGRVLGPPFLHIFDSGVEKGARGYLAYDDEGVRTEKTYLIREGRIVGRLHSRETAGKMGERPTGNARALSYRHPPIVRMRNTGIEPGEASFEDLLAEIEEGLYCLGFYGGETMGEMFTFTPQVAYRIRKGRIEEPVREATLSGNVFHTLAAIEAIGREVARRDDGGGCGKGGQAPLPVSHWCPPIRIARCLVGGRR
jgi:TldD protein